MDGCLNVAPLPRKVNASGWNRVVGKKPKARPPLAFALCTVVAVPYATLWVQYVEWILFLVLFIIDLKQSQIPLVKKTSLPNRKYSFSILKHDETTESHQY